ncbi:death-associated protein 1 homolog [Montipora capricornis]|uniref:death-associated protein 1 homolog n=1 Tax=Montipora capricornis TaxID=246305 RepID=UPI0035F203CB
MSSPPKNKDKELKAGHPPAVKAGGMRITSRHHQSQHPVPTPEEKAEEEEFAEPKEKPSDQKIIVSGVVTKGNADFKAEAIKVAHEKPVPQHDKRPPGPAGKGPGTHIQQPRKQ